MKNSLKKILILNIQNYIFISFLFSLIKSELELYRDNNNTIYINYNKENNNTDKERGVYSKEIIEEGNKLQLKLNEINLTYLYYDIIPEYGELDVSICENYNNSLTSINNGNNIIKFYKSYFITQGLNNTKDEIILIECKKGLKGENYSMCVTTINIYTDKTIFYIYNDIDKITNIPLYKFIKKNNENIYCFQGRNDTYLNIEIFSGNIEINTSFNNDDYTLINDDNKKIYIISKKDNFNITIKGNEDTFYSIYDYYDLYIKQNITLVGGNYFFKLDKEKTFNILDYYNYYDKDETFYYIGIYPLSLGCDINMKYKNPWKTEEYTNISLNQYGFYQFIVSSTVDNDYIMSSDNDSCSFYYASIHQLDNINGIPLLNNNTQYFKFDENLTNLTFSFPNTLIDNNLTIELEIFNEEKYKTDLYINDNKYNFQNVLNSNDSFNIIDNELYIKSNVTIVICPEELKKYCNNNYNHICKILLYVEWQNENNNNESFFKISFNNYYKGENDINTAKKKLLMYILYACGISLIIMIFVVLYNLIKMLISQKEDIYQRVEKLSFNQEMEEKEDKIINPIL